MREPKTTNENIVYHGWADASYRKYRAWMRLGLRTSDYEAEQREYRESIGAVKAFRSMLETLFNWPCEELDDAGDAICECVRTEFASTNKKKQYADAQPSERIIPEQGKIYTLHGGGSYLCVEVLRDESPEGAVMRRLSDGYVLKAHGLRLAQNGTIHWDYSTGGHWPEGNVKARMSAGEAVSWLKKYQGYEPIDDQTGCRKHSFDLTDETVDTILAALTLLNAYLSRDAAVDKGLL